MRGLAPATAAKAPPGLFPAGLFEKKGDAKMNTDELGSKLKKCSDIGAFLDENASEFNEGAFLEFLAGMMAKSGLNRTRLATMTGMSVSYVSELFCGKKGCPGKDALLKIAFGMGLALDEANRLLVLGGKAPLRPKARRDAIVIYSFEKGLTLAQADDLLHRYGQPAIQD